MKYQAEFYGWFIREKADIIVNCMLPDVQEKAGVGENPQHLIFYKYV